MSNYVNLSDKSLRVIIITLVKEFDENNINIEGNTIFEEDVVDIIDDILQYFGIKSRDIELYSYFISLCILNPNYLDKTVPIQRPTLNKYKVLHDETSRIWQTTTYRTIIKSYIELDKNMVNDLRSIDLYEYYDGQIINEEVHDSETTDDEILDITKIKD